jgi:hypothetical protein
MDNLRQQVEPVARTFYEAQEEAPDWDSEANLIKDEFREYARDAITLLEQHKAQMLDAA